MIRFCWRGIYVEAEFGFFVLSALIGLLYGTYFFLLFLSACLLHELGHLCIMLLFHRRVQRVSLGGAGILIAPVPEYGAYSQDFLVYCAGPLVNLLLGAFAWSMGEITAAALHLGLGALNLLPYSKLDGGAVCRCLLEMLGISQDTAERCMQLLCGAVTLFLLLAVKIFSVKNVSIPAMTVYLELTELLPVFWTRCRSR